MKIKKKKKKMLKRLRRELGEEGVEIYQLLCELADDKGQIKFEGTEDDMIKQIQDLYATRFGGGGE
jgi:hypothetical protein